MHHSGLIVDQIYKIFINTYYTAFYMYLFKVIINQTQVVC